MFCYVDRGAAILSSQCQALQHANSQQNNRSGNADRLVSGKKTDESSRATHNQQRDKKSIFTADQITDAAKEERAKGTYHKTDSECRKISNQRKCFVAFWIKKRGDDERQTAKD